MGESGYPGRCKILGNFETFRKGTLWLSLRLGRVKELKIIYECGSDSDEKI